ncbi:MAG: hypothetical protein JRE24_02125 [Deltaproteobacteria bacterium]|nr:hypothetical protein [Deltaproteobacteria bacterium]
MKIRQPTVNLITSGKYISPNKFKDVYEQARRTRAAIRRTTLRLSTGGFINYVKEYRKCKVVNREP